MELMLEDILDFCTGKQEDGTPMAGSSISVFGLTKAKQPITKQNVTFNQPLEIHTVGGCITVSIDFKKCPEFYRATKIYFLIETWYGIVENRRRCYSNQ